MSNQKIDNLIPAPAQLVLDFFDNELADVKFADIDRSVLQTALEQVQVLAEEQARAEAALRAAQDNLQNGLDGLLGKCQRALSYARIYAESDPELSRRLEAIVIPRRPRSGIGAAPAGVADSAEVRTGKRGRPPKTAPAERERADNAGSLFVAVNGEAGAAPAPKNGVHAAA